MELARFIKDIERCPYLPKDPEYAEWNRLDQERLAKINENYRLIYLAALDYRSSNISLLRLMSEFVIEMLRER